MSPIYGDVFHWSLLIQFVEVHRALGSGRIFIYYYQSTDPATKALLHYYSTIEPVVDVIPLHPINSNCSRDWACRQEFALHDCLLRARLFTYTHVAPIDIDELLMPVKSDTTLGDLMREIRHPGAHSYILRQRYVFRTDLDPRFPLHTGANHSDALDLIPFNRYFITSRMTPKRFVSKSIVNLEAVQYTGVHFVVKARDGMKSFNVSSQIAYLRHYRIPDWDGAKTIKDFGQIRNTTFPSILGDRVNRRMKKILKLIIMMLRNK